MKRWRTEGFTRRRGLAAALSLLVLAIAAGLPSGGSAQSASPASASFSRERLERVGVYIRNEIAAGTMPGAVILIQQHGRPVYFESFGVRDAESRHPMTPDTIFRLYSMAKPVTSVAAMMLVDDGKLSLDDPVAKYIPAFANVKVGVEMSDESGKRPLSLEPLRRPITIEDLLRHTSGLTYGFYGETAVRKLYDKSDIYDGDFDNAMFVERLAKLPLAEQPGTRWDYGHSTDVLGRVIEVISGQSLFQFEKQRLLDPLGMSETAFFVADAAQRPRIAEPMPHDRITRPIAGIKDPILPRRWESGGAGMVGTIGDYARIVQMLVNGGTLDGKCYLKPETVALMASDHIGPETRIIHDPFYFPGETSGFGLGFAVRTAVPANTSWALDEYRWDGAAGTSFFVDPRDDMFTIFMVQAPSQGGRLRTALKTLIYEALERKD
jgi:CubicO group peptidase (beta-lactamase class C family)